MYTRIIKPGRGFVDLVSLSRTQRRDEVDEAYDHRLIYKIVCVCRGDSVPALPMEVVNRAGAIQIRKLKLQGPLHRMGCEKYSLDPIQRTQRGWAAAVLKVGKNGKICLRMNFSMATPHSVLRPVDVGSSFSMHGSNRDSRGRVSRASIAGLLHLIWEGAGHCHYAPGASVEGEAMWRAVRDAAIPIHVQGVRSGTWGLADHLLLPDLPTGQWAHNNWKTIQAAGGKRIFVICEVTDESVQINNEGIARLDRVFGDGVRVHLPAGALAEARLSYPSGSVSMDQGRRTVLFAVADVLPNPDGEPAEMVAVICHACLMALTPAGLTCASTDEHRVFSVFERDGRIYRTIPRYDSVAFLGKQPEAELLDVMPSTLVEVFGLRKEEYQSEIPTRIQWYDKNFPGRLWYYDVAKESLAEALKRLPKSTLAANGSGGRVSLTIQVVLD